MKNTFHIIQWQIQKSLEPMTLAMEIRTFPKTESRLDPVPTIHTERERVQLNEGGLACKEWHEEINDSFLSINKLPMI